MPRVKRAMPRTRFAYRVCFPLQSEDSQPAMDDRKRRARHRARESNGARSLLPPLIFRLALTLARARCAAAPAPIIQRAVPFPAPARHDFYIRRQLTPRSLFARGRKVSDVIFREAIAGLFAQQPRESSFISPLYRTGSSRESRGGRARSLSLFLV